MVSPPSPFLELYYRNPLIYNSFACGYRLFNHIYCTLNTTCSAEKAGKQIIKVNPKGTSQHRSNCLNRVPKELSDRWHSYPHCGMEFQRDVNSGILMKKVGWDIASLKNANPSKGRRKQQRTA